MGLLLSCLANISHPRLVGTSGGFWKANGDSDITKGADQCTRPLQ